MKTWKWKDYDYDVYITKAKNEKDAIKNIILKSKDAEKMLEDIEHLLGQLTMLTKDTELQKSLKLTEHEIRMMIRNKKNARDFMSDNIDMIVDFLYKGMNKSDRLEIKIVEYDTKL